MRRALAWAAFAALVACAIYAFSHERLFDPYMWTPVGVKRLIRGSAVFWAFAGLVIWLRPRWYGVLVAVCVMTYSVVWCWRFFEPQAPIAVIYFLGSSFLLGKFVACRADGITALVLGLAIWIFMVSIAVFFPINTRASYAVAFLIPYLIEWRRIGEHWRGLRFTCESRREAGGLAVLLFVLLMNWLIALKPEVSSDGLAMHLAIPMAVAYEARWTFDFLRYTWALMPMGGDWAFTAANMLGGEAAARLLNFSMVAVLGAMVYQVSRRWLSSPAALLAAALFVSTPLVQMVTGSLMVENVWAVLVVGAALCVCRGELVWAGVLFGAALSAKVGTASYLPLAFVIGAVTLVKRANVRHRWRTAAAAMVLFAVFAAPPYLTAWAKTRNPMYPFYNHVFRSPYFETGPTAVQGVPYPHEINWKTPYQVTFRSQRYFEGRNGSFGFQYFLFLIPLLLVVNRKSPWAMLALGLGGALLTFATVPNLRYLYPALPLLSIGIAWLISEMPAMLGGVLAVIALNAWFFTASSWYHGDFALFQRAQVEEYLKVSAPQRALIDYLNRNAPGEPIGFFWGSPIAGLHGRAYSDQWRTYEFWKRLINAHSDDEIAAMFRERGIRYAISPVPFTAEYLPIKQFLERWTTHTGVMSGRWAVLEILPEPLSTPPQITPVSTPGVYDDADPNVEYTGAWSHGHDFPEASGASVTFSRVSGDSFRLRFEGQAITYVYTKAANRGLAEVMIDGRKRATIDQYSRKTQWQAKTVFGGLKTGQHTIAVRVLGRKDSASSDDYVDLDRFVVAQN